MSLFALPVVSWPSPPQVSLMSSNLASLHYFLQKPDRQLQSATDPPIIDAYFVDKSFKGIKQNKYKFVLIQKCLHWSTPALETQTFSCESPLLGLFLFTDSPPGNVSLLRENQIQLRNINLLPLYKTQNSSRLFLPHASWISRSPPNKWSKWNSPTQPSSEQDILRTSKSSPNVKKKQTRQRTRATEISSMQIKYSFMALFRTTKMRKYCQLQTWQQ